MGGLHDEELEDLGPASHRPISEEQQQLIAARIHGDALSFMQHALWHRSNGLDAGPVIGGMLAAVMQFSIDMCGKTDEQIREFFIKNLEEGLPQIRMHHAAREKGVVDGLLPRGRA